MRKRAPGRLPVAVLVAGSVLAGLLAACSSAPAAAPSPTLTVTPATSLVDQAMTVVVSGLPARGRADLEVASTAADGTTWTAHRSVTADARGRLGLAGAALFAQLQPSPAAGSATTSASASSSTSSGFFVWRSPEKVTWTLRQDGRTVATATTSRRLTPVGTASRTLTVAADGIAGVYDAPPSTTRQPAVLLLGGSEGGEPKLLAAAFAAEGFPVLAQAYFGEPGLPDTLSRVPVETVDKGLAWLRAQPQVDPARVWLVGGSRGSELALYEASRRPDVVHGVVGLSPSGVVHSAYPADGHSAWTLHGRELPYAHSTSAVSDVAAAVVPVQQIRGPVVLVCGESDTLWPSCPFSREVQGRRTATHTATAADRLLDYPQAGHHVDLLVPDEPQATASFKDGVSVQGDETAREQAWPQVVAAVRTR